MNIYSTKPKFQKLLSPVRDIFIRLRISPTAINILALAVSIIAGLLLYYSSFNIKLLLYIPFLAFIRIALNALDGLVARETRAKNQRFGEVLNETIDRLSDIAFFLGIAFASYVNFKLALVVLVFVLLSSYMGVIGKSAGGSRQYKGLMGKADRMFWLSAACAAILIWEKPEIMNWVLWFMLVLVIITIFQRFFAIKRELYR